jgi:hypothetical protein
VNQLSTDDDQAIQAHAGEATASSAFTDAHRTNRTGLPNRLKIGVEALSGMSLDGVKVHYNSARPRQLNALAYAQGTLIHVGPGQERHLPHEAWHIVQQAQGRVRTTMQMKDGSALNDDSVLEHEADVMGKKALAPIPQLQSLPEATANNSSEDKAVPVVSVQQRAAGTAPIQRKYELCQPGDVKPINNDHRAKTVRAERISGQTLGAAANSPSVAPFGWAELKAAGHTLANTSGASSHYNAVRAHLMNGRLGGPGDEKWNLVPAPAQINSMMSAGPETAAKLLVDAGHSVWIETTVSYYGNSTTATDFTSVVPNRITMLWGTMDGTVAQNWSRAIDLPVAPLQGAEAQEYKDWDSGKALELVNKLATQSNQVQAQAFELVSHNNLKFEILKAYPKVYLSMERVTKGRVLNALDEKQRMELLNVLGVVTSPDQLVQEALLPLATAGNPTEAQKLFAKCSNSDQRAMLISWKGDLLMHLGDIGDAWSKRDYTIFNYNGPLSRAALINSMTAAELSNFLKNRSKPQRVEILDEWAEYTFLGSDRNKKHEYVSKDKRIKPEYKAEYSKAVGLHNRAAEYKSRRPTRNPKKRF